MKRRRGAEQLLVGTLKVDRSTTVGDNRSIVESLKHLISPSPPPPPPPPPQ